MNIHFNMNNFVIYSNTFIKHFLYKKHISAQIISICHMYNDKFGWCNTKKIHNSC